MAKALAAEPKKEAMDGLLKLNQALISQERNRYLLEEIIGEGGYGVVFKCSDQNSRYADVKALII